MIPLWGQIRYRKGSMVAAESGNPQSTWDPQGSVPGGTCAVSELDRASRRQVDWWWGGQAGDGLLGQGSNSRGGNKLAGCSGSM